MLAPPNRAPFSGGADSRVRVGPRSVSNPQRSPDARGQIPCLGVALIRFRRRPGREQKGIRSDRCARMLASLPICQGGSPSALSRRAGEIGSRPGPGGGSRRVAVLLLHQRATLVLDRSWIRRGWFPGSLVYGFFGSGPSKPQSPRAVLRAPGRPRRVDPRRVRCAAGRVLGRAGAGDARAGARVERRKSGKVA